MLTAKALLNSFRAYLDANNLEADWSSVERASTVTLVNSLSMMSPYGPAEKAGAARGWMISRPAPKRWWRSRRLRWRATATIMTGFCNRTIEPWHER
jgi:hypothetical protein